MRFRYPSSIRWARDYENGYIVFECSSLDAALTFCARRWPGDNNIDHLQIFASAAWRMAKEVAENAREIRRLMAEHNAREGLV